MRQKYHNEMKISRQAGNRENQKRRTRHDIVRAAMELLGTGVVPTVPMAAEAASVSRATAYRYFPTQESLLLEIRVVTPAFEIVEKTVGSLEDADPETRLATLMAVANRTMFDEETLIRTALRTYHDQWLQQSERADQDSPVVREGRRLHWLDETLASWKASIAEADWLRLRAALALTIGGEAMSVMKDVCRIDDDDEAMEILQWTALALLRAGMREVATGNRRRT
jgi:AcrR family transcriptional regulator